MLTFDYNVMVNGYGYDDGQIIFISELKSEFREI